MSHPANTTDAATQEDFWSAHPCGAEGPFADRVAFRYRREGWIQPLISEVAARHENVIEVGCGQGIDGLGLCAAMRRGSYIGIDYSVDSVRTAQAMAADASQRVHFTVVPEFRVGSALDLPFADGSFDAVFSIGVMHHTPSTQRCVDEAFRVLKPGGMAYIALYRKYSLKVTVAKLLRATQAGIDEISGADRSIYRWLRRRGPSEQSGTMLLECFGVPFMGWYDEREMKDMFRQYELVELAPTGANMLHGRSAKSRNLWGFMWLMRARKPASR